MLRTLAGPLGRRQGGRAARSEGGARARWSWLILSPSILLGSALLQNGTESRLRCPVDVDTTRGSDGVAKTKGLSGGGVACSLPR